MPDERKPRQAEQRIPGNTGSHPGFDTAQEKLLAQAAKQRQSPAPAGAGLEYAEGDNFRVGEE